VFFGAGELVWGQVSAFFYDLILFKPIEHVNATSSVRLSDTNGCHYEFIEILIVYESFIADKSNITHLTCLKVVTCIPTHRLPGKLTLGATSKQNEIEINERQAEPEEEAVDELTPRGQILWIRGLTRLQHQVSERLRRPTALLCYTLRYGAWHTVRFSICFLSMIF